MEFIILAATALVVFAITSASFRKKALSNMTYKVHTEVHEIYEGDTFFLYESISNYKSMPMPNVRVDVTLPEGLDFCLYDQNPDGSYKTSHLHHIESLFVLKPESGIERRWRIMAKRRGIYNLGDASIVVSDIFGANKLSAFFESDKSADSRVTVLPAPIDIEHFFVPLTDPMGDIATDFSLTPDPLLYAGTREYRAGDSLSRVNWKASARMHQPMVDIDEYTEKNSCDVILNLQSRTIEDKGNTPEIVEAVEMGISVCASVFDRACAEAMPVRLICNAKNDISEKDYFTSERFEGRADTLSALRMLAEIRLEISCRTENMLEDILHSHSEDPQCNNIVIVTPYIDDTIVDFGLKMREMGVEVVIFATSSHKTMPEIPRELKVYYKTFKGDL